MSELLKHGLLVKFMLLFSVIILTDCTTKQIIPVKKISSEKTGWLDDDTFRIKAKGTASQEINDTDKRKNESLNNAISNAQKSTYDIFLTYYQENTGMGIQGYGNRKYEFMSYIRKIIATGKPVDIEYDSNQNCEILYEIKQERLKKKVMEFF